MATQAQTNPDLPSSWLIPGVFFKLNLSGASAGLNSIQKKLLLLGYKTSTGTMAVDQPIQFLQQSDANSYAGPGSDLARMYAAATSQFGGGVCDIYGIALTPPSGGTASTHLVTFATTATSAGSFDIYICGYKHSVAVANGDTATTVGANAATTINLNADLPVTAGAAAGVVTLTYKVKGIVGEDLPIIVNQIGAASMTASCGTVTYTNNATSTASGTVSVGGSTVTFTITNGDTPTTIAANAVIAINSAGAGWVSGALPCTASSAAGVLTLLYATDRVVHRSTAAVSVTGTTVTNAFGTAGAGTPTLTTTLSNLAAQSAYPAWCTAFNEVTSLGTFSTHLELYSDGVNQKGQRLFFGETEKLATAGAIPSGSTPALTASPRYRELWCQDSPQQAYELAARAAAIECVKGGDYPPFNSDFYALQTRGTVPLLLPHKVVRPGPADQNSAMYSYHMTALVVDEASNTLRILRGVTTSNAQDQRLWDWSCIVQLDFMRYDMNAFLWDRFRGAVAKVSGIPKTPKSVDVNSFKDAAYERALSWDNQDLYDDAEGVKSAFVSNPDPSVSGRFNISIPARPLIPVHQPAGVISLI